MHFAFLVLVCQLRHLTTIKCEIPAKYNWQSGLSRFPCRAALSICLPNGII